LSIEALAYRFGRFRLPPAERLLLVAAGVLAGCMSAPRVDADRWDTAPPLRHARAAHAVVATADAVYALAGTGAGGRPVLSVERFDGRAWTEESTLPGDGLNAPAAVVLNGRLYLIGGFETTTNVPTARVRVYDPATRRWSEAAPLPAPRGGHAAAVLGGRIHVIGGGNAVSTLADHTVFDPATGGWSGLAPLPRSMGSPAAVVHEGALWSIGGRSGLSDFGDVLRYDAAANVWRPMPPIPPRGTAGAVSVCGAVHVFGGESQPRQSVLADAMRLDREWASLAPMPTARNFARAVLFDGRVLVVGGSTVASNSHASAGSAVVERYGPRCSASPNR
jgi:N-acetylneuraminic acid mutarotase